MNPVVSPLDVESPASGIAGARAGAGVALKVRDFIALAKPRITLLVLVTAAGGMKLAGHASGRTWLATMVGTALVVGAANTFNMWLERDVDARMERTRRRPLPSGRLTPNSALWFGIVLAVVSLPILTFGVNAMTGLLGAIALTSYVLVYTPMKRHSIRALWVGAVPGAIPPLLGWSAVTGRIELGGLALFAILFVWQIPHFIAISIFRASDYDNAGLKVVPVQLGERVTNGMMLRYSIVLLAVSLVPPFLGLGGIVYGVLAVLLGGMFAVACGMGFRKFEAQRARWAKGVFAFSILYLVVLFGVLVAAGHVSPS